MGSEAIIICSTALTSGSVALIIGCSIIMSS